MISTGLKSKLSSHGLPSFLRKAAPMNCKGMTLLELMLAAVILSFSLLSIIALTGMVLGYNQLARADTTASTLAQDLIEELKNSPYQDIPTDCASEETISNFTRSCSYTADTPAANMTTIDVTVSWELDGEVHDVGLKTIVAK